MLAETNQRRGRHAKVWFPLYPMAPEHRLIETLQSTLKVYQDREVMIAYLKDFQDACRKYGVKLNAHIGKDMMHCRDYRYYREK